MKLENQFHGTRLGRRGVDGPARRGARGSCLPGASVESSEGDSYKGTMKVKIGPIAATYNGTIEIAEADEVARRAVMRAKARDVRGRGGAEATITSAMEEVSDGTRVTVETDLRVTGPPAQFGRGVMEEVSAKMMDRFADCLATKMGGPEPAEPPRLPPVPRRHRLPNRRRGRRRDRRGLPPPRCPATCPSLRRARLGFASRR